MCGMFVCDTLISRVYNIVSFSSRMCQCCPQIADFGMSRDLMYESYYVSHGGMIPVKWTAPEVNIHVTNVIGSVRSEKGTI